MTPVLTLTAVSKRFGRGATAVRAVRHATIAVEAGEAVAVMGPSGSGKSTLLCLMGGLLSADAGEVCIVGAPVRAISPAALLALRRTRIGFIFQKFNLLKALTALDNVALSARLAGARRVTARARAAQALATVGLAARAQALPRDLSGGEQQRVAVARALVTEPALILADEPTGSLDSTNGRMIIDMLCAQARRHGSAVVIVTHDHRITAAVDRHLWMEDGVLQESNHVDACDPVARAV